MEGINLNVPRGFEKILKGKDIDELTEMIKESPILKLKVSKIVNKKNYN